MSDNNQLIKDTLKADIVKTSDKSTVYSTLSPDTKRQVAVATALELIRADLSSSFSYAGTARKGADALEAHMQNLEGYANAILNAMDAES
ncbi:hypothetical protein [Vibrio coralliilyticus]|uniref:hypothetical protein n=1 Tax=Vibrio coralliilyticus TaxID=190893 RepID=UPI000BAAA0F5|nr:hypothetical protein [Vibrio coralliilyticus]NOI58296.1 hypothetical protein [Vibrio coralliilyticus]PAT67559.1 hypothetical protein CKA27_14815 [Vibrio coralliilyticus]